MAPGSAGVALVVKTRERKVETIILTYAEAVARSNQLNVLIARAIAKREVWKNKGYKKNLIVMDRMITRMCAEQVEICQHHL